MLIKKTTKTLVVMALLVCIAALTTGCGKGKGISIFRPNVSLNDYITINPLGYNGAGRVEVIFDYEQLAQDYENKIKKNPPMKYSGGKEGVEAASYVFSYYFPYRLVPEKNEGFVNGDVVNLTWALSEPGLEALENVLNLNYRYEDVQYTMEGLEEGRVVDIFEKMNVDYSGLNGEGTVSQYNAYGTFIDKNGEEIKVDLDVDHGYRAEWSNGDKVKVKVAEKYGEYYWSDYYGIEFAETETEFELEYLSYFPTENGEEVFEYIEESSLQNVNKAITDMLDKKYKELETTREVSFVGAAFYYNEDGNDFDPKKTNVSDNLKNKLILFYHIKDENVPNGWYIYVSLKNDVLMHYKEISVGEFVKTTRLDTKKEFYRNYGNYDGMKSREERDYPIRFKIEGVKQEYEGNTSLSNLCEGLKLYHAEKLKYDHLAVSGAVARYLSEY